MQRGVPWRPAVETSLPPGEPWLAEHLLRPAAARGGHLELWPAAEQNAPAIPIVHRIWIERRLEELRGLLAGDPARARLEIAKHLENGLTIEPRPSELGDKRAVIEGRVKPDSLLGGQEAVVSAVVGCGGWI